WLLESCNLGVCLNELVQLEHNDIAIQCKLKASHALFTALDSCKDGVIVILAEKEEAGVLSLLRTGFNRWLLESCNLGVCLNELVQLEHNDIAIQCKLKASHALFTALDSCKDGVIVTGPNHDIQYVNQSIEKLLGFRYEEMIGKNAYDLHRSDSFKTDIVDSINMHMNKGKVCHYIWHQIS
ncbi:unnamed protein product, partial [Medioppia subpectinata]